MDKSKDKTVAEILSIASDNFYDLFEVDSIITKAVPSAVQRIAALEKTNLRVKKTILLCLTIHILSARMKN